MSGIKKSISDRQQVMLMFFGSILIFTYVILRASGLSLTYDEIVTFDTQKTFLLADAGKSANIHLLNTFLIKYSCYFFGESELAIRLPNVFACLIYLYAAGRIAFQFNSGIRLHLFVLLVAMPFLIDFFSLARGYGLGVAFMLLSVHYFLVFCWNRKVLSGLWSILAAMLAVLANYTIMNYFLPLFCMLSLMILFGVQDLKSRILQTMLVVFCGGVFLAALLPTLFELKNGQQLYFGGRTDLYHDTIISLATCYRYFAEYGLMASALFVFCFFTSIALSLYFVFELIWRRQINGTAGLAVIFLLSLSAVVAQNKLLGTNYPVERTALMFYPLMVIVFVSGCNSFFESKIFNWTVTVLFLLHFILSANLSHCYSWRYDSGTKEMMGDLKAMGFGEKRIGIAVINAPSVNFYKTRFGLERLSVTNVSDFWEYPFGIEEYNPYYYNADQYCNKDMTFDIRKIIKSDVDVYYLDLFFTDELKNAAIPFEVIREYPYSRTKLVRIAD